MSNTWKPQNGEIIEYRPRHHANWRKATYVGLLFGEHVLCPMPTGGLSRCADVRRLPKTHTIIIDGEKCELSEDSFNNLKKALGVS